MKCLPQEITEIIVDHVAKYDDYLARQDLRNLRLVDKHCSQFATPLLFQTVPFWLGLDSLEHLTLIAQHPQISHYVTKLVFSPLRFVKFKDPFAYQSSVRSRFERDTNTHNELSLSFGKHVAAYKYYVESQDYLTKKSQDAKILVRALRNLPRLTDVTVVFESGIIGAREIMSAFRLLNGNEVTLDSEYTLPLLIEALSESERKLDTFNLVCNDSPSHELSCMSRRNFNYSHGPRFKYVSESPTKVTPKALSNAFSDDGNGKIRLKVINLMRSLRKFNMDGLNIDSSNVSGFDRVSIALEPIVAFALNLEDLQISPSVSGSSRGIGQNLDLPCFLDESIGFVNLQNLTLEHVESPEDLLLALFTDCSSTLLSVCLRYCHIIGAGGWSDMFRKARNAEFKVLHEFVLLECNGIKCVVCAQHYLKRITDKNPITGRRDNENNGSD